MRLPVALGEDVKGQSIVTDLARMPHLLIAGATGSGKSVCINSIITCLLLTNTPDDLRLLMIDPKMVELNMYNDVPHLLSPVVNEVDRAVQRAVLGRQGNGAPLPALQPGRKHATSIAITHTCKSETRRSCPTSSSSWTRWPT